MPVKFNLLPEEQRVNRSLYNFLKLTRSLGTIFLAMLILSLGGCLAFFTISYFRLKNIEKLKVATTSEIHTYEVSEQQLVLLKDRIGKIDAILASPNAQDNLNKSKGLLDIVGGNTLLNDLTIDPAKIEMTLMFVDNADIGGFFDSISRSGQFNLVKMQSLGLNPNIGYSATFDLEPKK